MITVICGTNRKDNLANHFARQFFNILKSKTDEKLKYLHLQDIPHDWFFPEMYVAENQANSLAEIQNKYLIPAEKFLFIVPEYNGSFPGVLKLFLDGCSIREYQKTFKGKKAALIGIASGRAGNLRGLDHLTDILNHVGTIIMPNKLPISSIENLLNGSNQIEDAEVLATMKKQVEELLDF